MKLSFLLVSVCILLPASLPPMLRAEGGASGMAFLKLGGSARGAALADALGVLSSGPEAPFYNPAGVRDSSSRILLLHRAWTLDAAADLLAASSPAGDRVGLALALHTVAIPGIEIRTRPGTPEGTFTGRNYALGLSVSYSVSEDVAVGATGKLLYEKILVDEATGFGMDLGMRWGDPRRGFAFGIQCANIGAMSPLKNERTVLPLLFRAGGARTFALDDRWELSGAADFVHRAHEGKSGLGTGLEAVYDGILAARGGYRFGEETKGLSLGLGVRRGFVSFDYAFVPSGGELGATHIMALSLSL
ncbi:MAG: PorV/PorQ family protein [Bacteroidota bacterium]